MKVSNKQWVFISLYILTQVVLLSKSYAIDCDPLKPTKPVENEVQKKLKIKANVLSRLAGSGEFIKEYKEIERDIRSDFPNADQVVLNDQLIYLTCSIIQSSDVSTDENFKHITRILRKIKGTSLYSMRKRFEVGSIEEKIMLLEEAKISGDEMKISLMLRSGASKSANLP